MAGAGVRDTEQQHSVLLLQHHGAADRDGGVRGGERRASRVVDVSELQLVGQNVYFGGKLLVSNGVAVATDRLGSVRANAQGEKFRYYPYGEERTSTVNGRDKFGTYFRDLTGMDYADQRYYAPGTGRFGSADPAGGVGESVRICGGRSGQLCDPQRD